MWSVAQPLLDLREAINERFPTRRRGLDGFIGDSAHFGDIKPGDKASGEHVPTDAAGYYRENGVVRAGDYGCILADGTDVGDELVRLLIQDGKARQRIAYIINKGKIYSRNSGWVARNSSGHGTWVHVSLRNESSSGANTTQEDVLSAAADTSPWFEEEDMNGWPAVPFEKGQRVKVTTSAGLRARTAPWISADTLLRRDDKVVTVAKGYVVKVEAIAYVEGRWWVRGGQYWYAAEFLA